MARGGKRSGSGRPAKSGKQPAEQAVSPISGTAPPAAHQFPPGQSGNPKGRPAAGATLREWINQLAAAKLTEAKIRKIARDRKAPLLKRAAAERMLRMVEFGDVADMEGLLKGEQSLDDLRRSGVNTEVIKKIKVKTRTIPGGDDAPDAVEVEREVELHDRSGEDFDRIFDRTEGRPKQAVQVQSDAPITQVVFEIVGRK